MHKAQNGFALVIVIWILTLLSLMAGSFALTMRRASSVTMALKNNAQAVALTESSLTMAEYMLQQPDPSQNWLADGSVYRIVRDDGSEIRIKIESESGKIDVNEADPGLLSAAIGAITSDKWQQQKLLNSILDWRDADDEARPHGAEKKDYLEAGLPYGPSNQPFQSLDELQLVTGIDADMFNRLQPWFTVYSGQKTVDMNQASPDVQEIVNNALLDGGGQTAAGQSAAPGNANQKPAAQTNNQTANNSQAANNQNSTYTIIIEVRTEDGGSASLEAVAQLPASGGGPGQSSGAGQPATAQPTGNGQPLPSGQPSGAGQAPEQILDWKQNQLIKSLFAIDMEARLITVRDEFTNNN
ncbi:MAG: type II secretion system protein GspK [Methylococcales bacterium]|nr:type II secretion system protein GspK [Methylococcales bacterium]